MLALLKWQIFIATNFLLKGGSGGHLCLPTWSGFLDMFDDAEKNFLIL
jgi:hypothetical protein